MSIFQQTFSAGDIIRITDMPMASFQNWMKRGLVAARDDAPILGGGSPGRHRRFTWYTVMEVALVDALTRVGLTDLSLAFPAAQAVTRSSHGPLPGTPTREMGFPFRRTLGRTFLAVAGEASHVALWMPRKDPVADIRFWLGNPEGFVLIDVLAVFDRVCGALGLDPTDIFKEVYPQEA